LLTGMGFGGATTLQVRPHAALVIGEKMEA
jgi:hypothetical protein